MYACLPEIGYVFSKVCAHPAMQPPIPATHPTNAKGPEPRCQDSGLKRIIR